MTQHRDSRLATTINFNDMWAGLTEVRKEVLYDYLLELNVRATDNTNPHQEQDSIARQALMRTLQALESNSSELDRARSQLIDRQHKLDS